MRLLTIRFLLALLVVSGASFRAAGKSPEKLPGRSIETKQLPETIRRFVLRHYSNLSRFNYRWDKRFYYAFNDNGGYMLFSADGALRGFRYYLRQMPCELADLLPELPMTISGSIIRNILSVLFFRQGREDTVRNFSERTTVPCTSTATAVL